jgi:regulator of protease activity HflC (stomatin/prohibitin superfamily)
MPDPHKLQAKLQKSEAEAERDRAALRAKAEKKIAKIKNELRAEEARLDAWLERRREKTGAKLDALGRSLDGGAATAGRRVTRRARAKR